jgi:hypothetical protein
MSEDELIDEVLKTIDAGSPRDTLLRDPEHGEAYADILRTIDLLEAAGSQILPEKALLNKILLAHPSVSDGGFTRPNTSDEKSAPLIPTSDTAAPEPIKGRETYKPTSPYPMNKIWKITVPVLITLVLLGGALYYWNTSMNGSEEYTNTPPAPVAQNTPTPAPTAQPNSVAAVAATGNVDDAVTAVQADADTEAALMNQELNDSSSADLNSDAQAMGGFDSSYGNY